MAPTARDLVRLQGVHPTLVQVIVGILAELPMFVVEGVRTAERQHTIFVSDPNATNCDGYIKLSSHQAKPDGFGHAVDCAFLGPSPFALTHDWKGYGARLEAAGCIWGGRWKHPVDLDHGELPYPVPSVPK